MLSLKTNKVGIMFIQDPLVSKGGIILSESSRQRSDQGIVKYVGPDCRFVKPADYVVFNAFAGTTVRMNAGFDEEGKQFAEDIIIIPEDELLLKVHPPATPIAGLFHVDGTGDYFPATYESTMRMVQEQFYELPRLLNLKDRDVRSK